MNRLIDGKIVNMRDFTAPYEYREYPKWVNGVLVQDADEETAALGNESAADAGLDNLREALVAEAKALGLNPHHRAGVEKLREMIGQAKS